ncbi:MAG: single-stranded DNA-binding protein [Clostridia bacterium]|nr:single-stranded DNA-binding protein [Clostridia bacterium]
MLNKVILIGRLTKDPELRYTPAGAAVATFSLAVERPFANQQGEREVDFINIVVWRKLAETCANQLGKGRLVAVDGRIQVRSYEAKDGQKRWITDVVAESVRFLDWPKEGGGSSSTGAGNRDDQRNSFGTEVDVPYDDLPF